MDQPRIPRLARPLRVDTALVGLVFAPLALLLVAVAGLSLRWRMVHDFPLFHFWALQMERFGAVPYRDFHDTSMPGVFLFHRLMTSVVGYSDLAFRCVDLLLLALALALVAAILARLSRRVAFVAVVLVGLAYLSGGAPLAMQRDYLGLIPVLAAVWLAGSGRLDRVSRTLGVGALVGVACTIKPHLGLALPSLLLWLWFDARPADAEPPRDGLARGFWICWWAGLGLLVPVLGALGWIAWLGGLPAFWELFSEYLPEYLRLLTPELHATWSGDRPRVLWQGFRALGGHAGWLAPGFLGFYLALYEAELDAAGRRRVRLLGALCITFAIYPALAGQFFPYHWTPFHLLAAMAASLCAIPLPRTLPDARRVLPVALLAASAAFNLQLAPESQRQLRGQELKPLKMGWVDAMAALIREKAGPGETVQPLDWVSGSVLHAMLLAEARAATRYQQDHYFYLDAEKPVIRRMREDFIAQLEQARPVLIIHAPVLRPQGFRTTQEFPELDAFLAAHYRATVWEPFPKFTIYERIEP